MCVCLSVCRFWFRFLAEKPVVIRKKWHNPPEKYEKISTAWHYLEGALSKNAGFIFSATDFFLEPNRDCVKMTGISSKSMKIFKNVWKMIHLTDLSIFWVKNASFRCLNIKNLILWYFSHFDEKIEYINFLNELGSLCIFSKLSNSNYNDNLTNTFRPVNTYITTKPDISEQNPKTYDSLKKLCTNLI